MSTCLNGAIEMKIKLFSSLALILLAAVTLAQSPRQKQKAEPEAVVRISTKLVQIDVAVTDKNDQIVRDLKLENFELFEDGRKQEVRFIEFVDLTTGRRTKDVRQDPRAAPSVVKPEEPAADVTAASLKRVVAFVVDDLTMPSKDLVTVRQMLANFVDNRMGPNDLVAIVRSVGGRGLLQQFTADRNLLRRAIAALNPTSHPFSVFSGNDPLRVQDIQPAGDAGASDLSGGAVDVESVNDDTNQTFRALMALSTTNFVVESMKDLPGRKSLVLLSGGLPLFGSRAGVITGNVSFFFTQLADNATRSGVVINTMDVRGLNATPGVGSFADDPGKSGLGVQRPGEGRFGQSLDPTIKIDKPLDALEGRLGLRALSDATGGVTVVNTNNFEAGLGKALNRGSGYYLLAYTPENENFDGKFRKLQVKVRRDGVKVYTRDGYLAREDKIQTVSLTKEEEILRAARSPLASSEVEVSANILFKQLPENKAAIDVHLLIDASNLHFKQEAGKYQTSFEIAGFVFDQYGKPRGGFNETVNANLTPESYRHALATGMSYAASTTLPPGYFQLRVVVREAGTGSLGTLSRYLEIPDLTSGRLTMSSIFLYAANPAAGANSQPEPLLALRQLSRRQDLRYAALIYNPKLDKGKPQLTSQLIVSQGGSVLFREPEQPVEVPANSNAQIVKLGQLALAKVKPGRYTLTLVINDQLADKKKRSISRSAEFTVVE